MSYDIVWDVSAYQRLEKFVRDAPIGPAVDAFDEIERLLRKLPEQEGESRAGGRRILIVAPLGVIFRVHERLKEVHVLDVWKFPQRNQ